MRIGILTQPLYVNYGGILQCYALQKTLQQLGHDTFILQREFCRNYTLIGGFKHYVKQVAKLILGKRPMWHYYVSQDKREYIAKYTTSFINNYINTLSKKCYSTEELIAEFNSYSLDAVIVGSDQVWRPDYSPCQPNYFFDFLSSNDQIKKISYAASFGTESWHFNNNETKYYSELLQLFDAVSVRETSAINLCKEYFNVDAIQVLDPTMLLDKEDYVNLIPETKKRGELFCYILDRTLDKQNVVTEISKCTRLSVFENMPLLEPSSDNIYSNLEDCVVPPVENWLSAFIEAEMVVTDSFHGCVFSIIFNKPFWVIGNKQRGMARFESLLREFGLQDRLISDIKQIDIFKPITWSQVNARRKVLKRTALQFITQSLIDKI